VAAVKLAADINAISAGSAKADGDTVTVAGRVEVEKRLIVPEGVTLDLTVKDAALELRDGAVLTVNGTVNAMGHGDHGKGWVEGSLRMGDGEAVIAGTGTINLTSKGRLLNIGSDRGHRRLTLDGVTLVGLPDNDSPLVGIHENGELVLLSGAITGNTRVGNDWVGGGGVAVYRGTFTMEGGEISGNGAQGTRGAGGGGIEIGEEAVFTMKGGTITGNSASGGEGAEGGGVAVRDGGAFTMEGGAVSGNTLKGYNANGGGVFVSGSTFTMRGGAISGNTAQGGGEANGGGVRLSKSASFIMEGGVISGNTSADSRFAGGGGVAVHNGSTFTMRGGAISGNTAKGGNSGEGAGDRGGGVNVPGATFIMEGGTIYGNADSLPAGTDPSLANSARIGASLGGATAKWGTGGAYTKGGVSQPGGSDIGIGNTDDTLIAIPAP
jgi:hypothetical protein